MEYFSHIYHLVSDGTRIVDGGFTEFSPDSPHHFLGDPENTGFIFSRYVGQVRELCVSPLSSPTITPPSTLSILG